MKIILITQIMKKDYSKELYPYLVFDSAPWSRCQSLLKRFIAPK